jgi:hypothetical protein
MEKRYQIRVGTHKVDFRYDADTQTWRARRPGTQDYTTGQAGTLEAARDAVRRYIQDEEPAGESLHHRASPARRRDVSARDRPGTGLRLKGSARQEAAGKGDRERILSPQKRGKERAGIRGNFVP